ncbi:MAG TPA: hypothetical protein PLH94_00105 [Fimbriimonadaceae bacterium]|nr:hypothetical protein [Fimbriimonadaceae bacterium]
MWNLLPALILLMLQGTCCGEMASRHTDVLGAWVRVSAIESAARQSDPEVREALRALLRAGGDESIPGGVDGWSFGWLILLDREPEATKPDTAKTPESSPPDPPLLRPIDGYAFSARSRDGPLFG